MDKFTYIAAKAKKTTFAKTGLTKSDISFAEGNHYAILYLKQKKTDVEYIGI